MKAEPRARDHYLFRFHLLGNERGACPGPGAATHPFPLEARLAGNGCGRGFACVDSVRLPSCALREKWWRLSRNGHPTCLLVLVARGILAVDSLVCVRGVPGLLLPVCLPRNIIQSMMYLQYQGRSFSQDDVILRGALFALKQCARSKVPVARKNSQEAAHPPSGQSPRWPGSCPSRSAMCAPCRSAHPPRE